MLLNDTVPRIHLLEQTLANQIAAGEVVERPASVIKELLENALDANSDRINIELERGGNTLIRIIDNGVGIHPDDLPLILERHSTSKIKQLSDLESLQSLGFRGEALASISSVSEFSIVTAIEGEIAQTLTHDAISGIQITPSARNRGTTVEARNLFFNTPARRKFLRSEQTEYLHCFNMIKRQVLGRFDVAVQVVHNGRRTLNLSCSSNDYSQRIAQICGQGFLKESISIEFEHDGMRLWGWLGQAGYSRNQTDLQYFYLNGRYLRDKQINHAIRLAYSEQIPTGRYPCYALFFEMDSREVDVNVHPSKQEVRFAQIRQVHDFIFGCIERALNDKSYQLKSEVQSQYKTREQLKKFTESKVDDVIEDYGESQHRKIATLDILANRYLIFSMDNSLGIFDSFTARIEKVKKEIESDSEVAAMPLLMPRIISGSEQSIEAFLNYQDRLRRWGIILLRIAPDRIHVSHLPKGFEFADFQVFFDDVNHQPTNLNDEELFNFLLNHLNDNVSVDEIDKSIQTLFNEFNRINFDASNDHFSEHADLIRLLDVNDLERLLKNKS